MFFSYSGSSGILDSDGKQNIAKVGARGGGGGHDIIAFSNSSHVQLE